MINFIEIKKNYIIALAILFVVVSLSDTTYSLFLKSDTTSQFSANTGLLDLKFVEDKQITLESTFPMDDSEGEKLTPYTLTIKNTGNLIYKFDLKMLSNNHENEVDNKYIKVKVNDQLPHTLFTTNNVIASNIIIYPDEEITFNINVWLDKDTPNGELGKQFIAKVVTTGEAIYKTLDESGANHPNMLDGMIPVYYDETDKTWKKADSSNTDESYRWYDYNSGIWANAVKLNDTNKQIYDITGNNNLANDNFTVNNGNLIINEKPLDIGLSNYHFDKMSTILRVKLNESDNDKIYFISNGKISYYYDLNNKKFIFTNGVTSVSSITYIMSQDTWYIIGYTYDGNTIKFYANGSLLSSTNIYSGLSNNNSFKIGTDNQKVSNITIGDIYIYNNILSEEVINNNYKTSINIVYNDLIAGYNEFNPMTIKEYYSSSKVGTKINSDDINSFFVWIPRFKYKLWNVTGENNIDSYNAYEKGVDIVFEKDSITSGVIKCEDNKCYSDDLMIASVTNSDNLKYYTHPAFKTIDQELTGFWVSKYEASTSNNDCLNNKTSCNSSALTIQSKYGNRAWTNNYLSNFYQAIKKIGNNYNMIKNTEWGAIAYLSHSKYGVCQNNTCQTIQPNNTYTSGSSVYDSTTNNPFGVYDMAGSASEYTMSNYTNKINELSLNNTFFNNIPISNNDYNLYYENGFILGDATKELSLTNGIWYNSKNTMIGNNNNWLIRGGIANQEHSTIFTYNATNDIISNYISTRIVVK